MKNLLLLFILFIALGCKDDDNNLLDPNAMISLRPEVGTKAADNPEHLTALEIVTQATDLNFYNYKISDWEWLGRGFADNQRDLVNVRLLMRGTDIIGQDGSFIPEFIEAEDMVLTIHHSDNVRIDTVGYVKNETLRTAEAKIKEAHAREDYKTCYEIFDKAFTFVPITGAEWRELKAKNEN